MEDKKRIIAFITCAIHNKNEFRNKLGYLDFDLRKKEDFENKSIEKLEEILMIENRKKEYWYSEWCNK